MSEDGTLSAVFCFLCVRPFSLDFAIAVSSSSVSASLSSSSRGRFFSLRSVDFSSLSGETSQIPRARDDLRKLYTILKIKNHRMVNDDAKEGSVERTLGKSTVDSSSSNDFSGLLNNDREVININSGYYLPHCMRRRRSGRRGSGNLHVIIEVEHNRLLLALVSLHGSIDGFLLW